MKARAQELKAEARANKNRADGERDVLAKIAAMPEPDRAMAERLHAIVQASAPDLSPKTWYGMPAYAKDGKVVCFFKSAREVQVEVRDVRFQRSSEPRRRRHVADLLRADGVDRRRRGKDRRAREESGELRTEVAHEIHEATRERQEPRGRAQYRRWLRQGGGRRAELSTARLSDSLCGPGLALRGRRRGRLAPARGGSTHYVPRHPTTPCREEERPRGRQLRFFAT